ncbi:hypothetical protein G6677_00240 [Polynucleobacter paneuropaeus]|nr:hypothetical protein [Polynucleobacter paneuropaeus]MBT8604902.1 hypothetical protein [Polynucleobacter paneuropaeus]
MDLLITILSGIAILFGLGLMFSRGMGSLIAAGVSVIAGIAAYDQKSLIPLLIGFGCLWLLRLLGFEKR